MEVVRNTSELKDIREIPAGTMFEYNGGVFLRTNMDVNTNHRQPINAVAVNLESGNTFSVMYNSPADSVLVTPLEGKVVLK